jgi:predicted nuclease with TOPRIM domain
MGALDTAKEIAKIAVTSGLSTEIIGLLEKKITLLTEQVTALEQEKSVFETENSNLKKKIENLEQQLERLRPKDDLHPDAIGFLKLLFVHSNLGIPGIMASLGITKGMAEYHRDNLLKAKMIARPNFGVAGQQTKYHIRAEGRAYLVEHDLV